MDKLVLQKYNRIEMLLVEVLNSLYVLDENNFSSNFNEIIRKFSLAKKLKNELNSHQVPGISSQNKKISDIAKLISIKYDNVIKEWKQKTQVVQKELELLQNQKKLTSYRRQ